MSQPQQHRIWAVSATCTTAYGNTRSLTQWGRPGIKPTTSWFLVGLVSAEARRELSFLFFIYFPFLFYFLFSFFIFLGSHLWHMEVPRLGVKLELQLPAYTTAMAMWDLSCDCNLQHSSRQCRIFNPLSEAKNPTGIPMDTSWVHNLLNHHRNSLYFFF